MSKIVKLAVIRDNEHQKCPFGLNITIACRLVGNLVQKMMPLTLETDFEVQENNINLFLWNYEKEKCIYASKIIDNQTPSVECEFEPKKHPSSTLEGSMIYTKNFSEPGFQGVYTFPTGYYQDNSIDRGQYYGLYSIESIAQLKKEKK